jgi:hypothetical protein
MSAAGNYCSHAKESNKDPATTKANNAKPPTRDAVRDIDPLQININLNLVLNKEKSRSGTPHTCTAADIYRYKSLEKLQMGNNTGTGMATSRAKGNKASIPGPVPGKKNVVGTSKAPTAPSSSTSNNSSRHNNAAACSSVRAEPKKSARSTMRPRQTDIMTSVSSKTSSKLVSERGSIAQPAGTKLNCPRPKDGRASAVPQGSKKLGSAAIDQLCKNIKDLLGPMNVVGLTNDKSIIPASKLSPRRDKLGRNAKVGGNAGTTRRGTFLQHKSDCEAELPKAMLGKK